MASKASHRSREGQYPSRLSRLVASYWSVEQRAAIVKHQAFLEALGTVVRHGKRSTMCDKILLLDMREAFAYSDELYDAGEGRE